VDTNLIGDLASSWSLAPDGLTWHFKLVKTAAFYDKNNPTVSHPVTAADVIYTYWLVQNASGNYLQSYFPVVNGAPILERMWTGTDAWDLYIKTSSPYGPLTGAMTSIPILPKYLWETQAWDWANFDTRTGQAAIVGSGPFYYNLPGKPSLGSAELVKSPVWYATQEYGWELRTNRLVIKNEGSADANLADYNVGEIDVMMEVTPTQYGTSLPGQKFAQSTGFVYEFNLNQMTDAFRATLGNPFTSGSNSQILLNPVVKRAIAMGVDKQAFVTQVLNGLGSVADSLVPDVNPWHYWYGVQPGEDPNKIGRAPIGEEPIPYDPVAARALLVANGWAYDSAGLPAGPTTTPLCKVGGSEKLQFRFWTLDTSSEWDAGAQLLAQMEWAIGVDITTLYDKKNTAFMNGVWAAADYDMWLWDWMFSPTSDVSTDIMQVLTTEAIGSWSDVYWSDPVYDAIYYESLQTSDPVVRMALTDELQRIAYENMGCQLIAYRKELYAAGAVGGDQWQNYGNWEARYTLMPDQLYPWLYMQIYPLGNPAPQITSFDSAPNGDTTHAISFTASATDGNQLEYRWFWGDGNKTGWLTNPNIDKTYPRDGLYTAYLAVKEVDGSDHFVTWRKATVTVIDTTNAAPKNVAFTFTPSDPDSGTRVQFTASATDSDPLTYLWNFGDGTTGYGQTVSHQFTKGDPSYNVKLMVDDGHLGQEGRPVNSTQLIQVKANTAPTCQVPDVATGVYKGQPHNFVITSVDPDSRDVRRYTWEWGDGSTSVTSVPGAVHTYPNQFTYTLRVYVDDQTGLAGHNVSDTGLINVQRTGTPYAPVVGSLVANLSAQMKGHSVKFTATATDQNADLLLLTFDFGDGQSTQVYQTSANQTVMVNHTYMSVNLFAAYVTAFDGAASDMSDDPALVDVQATFDLTLVAGWNFVSIAWTGYGYKASNMGLTPGSVVCSWDPATVRYDKTYTVGTSPPFKDFSILGSTGYWVFSAAGQTLYLGGTVPSTPQSRSITVPTGGGWAIIAFNSMSTTKKASNIPAMYTGGTVQIVASYNAVAKTYATWTPGSPPFKDFYLVPGAAYWVYLSASGTLTYSP
jgi:ABC-type transport system substrate-binding protein